MNKSPLPNGSNGRDSRGRFAAGNAGGPGNPFAKRTAAIRMRLLDVVLEQDLDAIVAQLVALAKDGDLAAIREVLDRTAGKATPGADPDRLELQLWELGQQIFSIKHQLAKLQSWDGAMETLLGPNPAEMTVADLQQLLAAEADLNAGTPD